MREEADAEDCDMVVAGVAVDCAVDSDGDGDEGRVLEWEMGLPAADDLTPLSQSMISPELAYAFSIAPEPARTLLDVHRASESTVFGLRRQPTSSSAAATLKSFSPFPFLSPVALAAAAADDPIVLDGDDAENGTAALSDESSCLPPENSGDDHSNRTLKRPRLVWTAQLHKRFIDAVAHLGISNAVPKSIMQLMNVEGLTRENVASHLQKYRLFCRRREGVPDEGPSSSNLLPHEPLTSMPIPMRIPYGVPPPVVPMPVFGVARYTGHNGAMGMMPVVNHYQAAGAFHGHPNGGAIEEQQRDCSAGNKSGLIVSYPRVIPRNK